MKKILIAEDDRELHMLYRLMLGQDYEIIEAYNGQEAVDHYREHRPDLVLMDIKMPVKNGDVAIGEIMELDPGAKIVAVTAYRYTEEDLGVYVLRKGFTRREFLEVVKRGLEDR
jgi:CheY-like chemotaxis protein